MSLRPKPPCPQCGWVHESDLARAVGAFQPDGPSGYWCTIIPNPPLRATRAEAERDGCRHRAERKTP